MTKYDNMRSLSPIILRIGIALVFLWFGTQQLTNAAAWTRLIPEFIISMSGLSATTLVHFNGAFEIVFGIALLIGFFTRITSFLLALHLLSITFTVGYGPIGVRDFGLSMATIAIFLYGVDSLCLDNWLEKKKIEYNSVDENQ